MTYLIVLPMSVLVGAGLGYLAERVPASSLMQSVGAALLGWLGGTVAHVVVWFLRSWAPESGIAAVSVGVSEGLISASLVVVAAAGLHWAIGWGGEALTPSLVAHRPVVLGALGGAFGTLMFVVSSPFTGRA